MTLDIKIKPSLCPECGGNIISIQAKGETVCAQCGLIISEKIIDFAHSGKRAYNAQERLKRGRTGAPISSLLPDLSLTTVIERNKIDNPDLKRAAKWNTRINWEKRNLLIASTELKRISSNLNLPEHIKKTAFNIYKKAFESKLLRGRSINGMISACLFYAIRKNRLPRMLQEVLNESSAKAKEVRRCYYILIKELNLKLPTTDPTSLLPRYIAELSLNVEIERIARKILKQFISQFSISGKDPKGLCAGAIYLACKLKNVTLTQKIIADTIGITEVTLRSRYRELVNKLKVTK